MDIKQDDHSFYIGDPVDRDAEITYISKDDEMIMIDHTVVSEKFRGGSVGRDLVKAVVDYARENNLKITASCTYAKKMLERNEDYKDVYAG